MKKFFSGVVFLVLILNISSEQNSGKKGCVGFSFGSTVPIGDFASTASQNAGYAKTGVNINLTGGYNFRPNFGIVGSLLGFKNNLDYPLASLGFKTEPWTCEGLFVGVLGAIKIVGNLFVDFKPMLGLINVQTPKISFNNKTITDNESVNSLCFDFGTSLRYDFPEKWCGLLNVDYLQTNPGFSNIRLESVQIININIGLGYRF